MPFRILIRSWMSLFIQGIEADSVYVELNVQPVDAVEKIYMKVTVK